MINDQGSDVDQLAEWLGQRLDEDERIARAAKPGPWHWDGSVYATHPTDAVVDYSESAEHIAAWDPARVLREIEAKRQLLDEHQDVNDGSCGTCVDGQWGYPTHGGSSPQRYPCRALRFLALPYADRPGYREEWRP